MFVIVLFSCRQNTQEKDTHPTDASNDTLSNYEDNTELIEIYKNDQADRKVDNIDWSIVSENDRKREKRIYELIEEGALRTSNDYHNAAMIFQHGMDSTAYGMAVKLMKKSIDLDPNANKWLFAAATDRYLLSIGEPQIYGTQFSRKNEEGAKWERSNMDTTKITDAQRIEYDVETLAQQQEKLHTMNLIKLSEFMTEGKTIVDVRKLLETENSDNSKYNISESGINSFGYELMAKGMDREALEIFKINTELFPNAYNTFDSYGECLLKLGDKENAIKAYERSVELKPDHEGGIKILSELKI